MLRHGLATGRAFRVPAILLGLLVLAFPDAARAQDAISSTAVHDIYAMWSDDDRDGLTAQVRGLLEQTLGEPLEDASSDDVTAALYAIAAVHPGWSDETLAYVAHVATTLRPDDTEAVVAAVLAGRLASAGLDSASAEPDEVLALVSGLVPSLLVTLAGPDVLDALTDQQLVDRVAGLQMRYPVLGGALSPVLFGAVQGFRPGISEADLRAAYDSLPDSGLDWDQWSGALGQAGPAIRAALEAERDRQHTVDQASAQLSDTTQQAYNSDISQVNAFFAEVRSMISSIMAAELELAGRVALFDLLDSGLFLVEKQEDDASPD